MEARIIFRRNDRICHGCTYVLGGSRGCAGFLRIFDIVHWPMNSFVDYLDAHFHFLADDTDTDIGYIRYWLTTLICYWVFLGVTVELSLWIVCGRSRLSKAHAKVTTIFMTAARLFIAGVLTGHYLRFILTVATGGSCRTSLSLSSRLHSFSSCFRLHVPFGGGEHWYEIFPGGHPPRLATLRAERQRKQSLRGFTHKRPYDSPD